MSVIDASHTRMVQREIGKRNIDITTLDVHVHHGVVYLRGTVRHLRGHEFDLEAEIRGILNHLRAHPEFRDIVNELQIRQ